MVLSPEKIWLQVQDCCVGAGRDGGPGRDGGSCRAGQGAGGRACFYIKTFVGIG